MAIQRNPTEKALAKSFGRGNFDAAKAAQDYFFPQGIMGRVDEARSPEQLDVMNRYKAGLDGYTGQESQAFREQAARGLDSQAKTGMAQLAKMQARSGVRGPAAAAQAANLQAQRGQQQAELEQGLVVKNADEKQNRLNQYGQVVQQADANTYQRQLENLNRASSETAGKYGAFSGILNTLFNQQNMKTQNKLARKSIGAAR